MAETSDTYRCERHHVELDDDAIRGVACPYCDAEEVERINAPLRRLWAWIVRCATFS